MFKSLLTNDQCFDLLREIIVDIWQNEICPTDWNTGLLRILPKKWDTKRTIEASCFWNPLTR